MNTNKFSGLNPVVLSVLFLFLLTGLSSCKNTARSDVQITSVPSPIKTTIPAFQAIIDSSKLEGAILVYDLQNHTFFSNDMTWSSTGHLPASTFKIPNSIIALETGIVASDTSLLKWNGEKRRVKRWEQDLTFRQAFHYSCYPCYQAIARTVGVDTMKAMLAKFEYPGMVVDSNSLDHFWLESDDSAINQFQQIDFLRRFYLGELPISSRTDSIMRSLMVIQQADTYTISGKTGWSRPDGQDNGWFVGYVEKGHEVFFFATNVSPGNQYDMNNFHTIRKEVTYAALKELNILEERPDL